MIHAQLRPGAIEHIVFDWNGTLLDDLTLAVAGVNRCAERFGVAPVTRERYRDAFDFPISSCYARLGFDLECVAFADVMATYLEHFNARVGGCALHEGALAVLDAADAAGIGASILSASHGGILGDTIRAKQLDGRFAHVMGLAHHFATSKSAEAVRLQQRLGGDPARTLLVGDTLHDLDVANATGWRAVLVASGHQTRARLLQGGVPVLDRLDELLPCCRDHDSR